MRTRWRFGSALAMAAATMLLRPSLAGAALAITVPPSTVNLGSAAAGSGPISQQLGTVTVVDDRALGLTWPATVAASVFTTGSASPAETIGKASISYWSGAATATSGTAVRTPGQLTAGQALTLSTSRIAFSAVSALVTNSTSWRPTIVVTIPSVAVSGTYTGTITHSVA